MKTLTKLTLVTLLLSAAGVQAQVSIPVNDVTLAFSANSLNKVSIDLGGTARNNVYADPFKIAKDPAITGISQTTLASTALWFCMDPLQKIYYQGNNPGGSNLNYASTDWTKFNVFTDNLVTAASLGQSGGLTGDEKTALENLFKRNFVAATTNASMAAALQIAVWEIVNENSPVSRYAGEANPGPDFEAYDVYTGDFKVTAAPSGLLALAQNMINTRESGTVTSVGTLDFLIDGTQTNGGNTFVMQDMVGWEAPIPESGNFATGALGLLALGVVARLRSRKAKAAALKVA